LGINGFGELIETIKNGRKSLSLMELRTIARWRSALAQTVLLFLAKRSGLQEHHE
jgi:hypothetical protein